MAKSVHLLSDIQLRAWMAKGEAVAKSDGEGLTFMLSNSNGARLILGSSRRSQVTCGATSASFQCCQKMPRVRGLSRPPALRRIPDKRVCTRAGLAGDACSVNRQHRSPLRQPPPGSRHLSGTFHVLPA